ncbi:ATP-binding protein [Vibrio sp. CAIM 722]|uniref:ATP-binding protein n=2 Tax=Vibrio eleionomae TaxID=2653505 RepID=A0A7X4LQF8_9VIBR|nr:ATP-binding protein [Vibrio eleionomae]
MTSISTKQHGNFMIEFAIVGIFFAMLLVFSADIVIKLSTKGKLDRLSYSIANVIKERTQLFGESDSSDDDYEVSDSQAKEAYIITVNSLKRTVHNFDSSQFGFDLKVRQRSDYGTGDQLVDVADWNSTEKGISGANCEGSVPDKELIFQTSWGRSSTVYQVTLCYDTVNWFGELVGKDFSTIAVSSLAIGR